MEVGDLLYGLIEYGDKEEQIMIEAVCTSYTISCFPDIVPAMFDLLIQLIMPTALLRIQILLSAHKLTTTYPISPCHLPTDPNSLPLQATENPL